MGLGPHKQAIPDVGQVSPALLPTSRLNRQERQPVAFWRQGRPFLMVVVEWLAALPCCGGTTTAHSGSDYPGPAVAEGKGRV